MKIVTFYSYKGGVGRSTLLCNSAFQLASKGMWIACVDFDIESTGLHPILRKRVLKSDATALQHILTSDSNALPSLIESAIRKYALSDGGIYLIPAAIDYRETKKVNERMVRDRRGLLSNLDKLIEVVESQYRADYLFFDSRSGVSEMAEPALEYSDCVVIAYRLGVQQQIGVEALLYYLFEFFSKLGRTDVKVLLVPSNVPRTQSCIDEIQQFTLSLKEIRKELLSQYKLAADSFLLDSMTPIWSNSELNDYGARVIENDGCEQDSASQFSDFANRLEQLFET